MKDKGCAGKTRGEGWFLRSADSPADAECPAFRWAGRKLPMSGEGL